MTYSGFLQGLCLLFIVCTAEIGNSQSASSPAASGSDAKAACTALRKMTLPPSSIALPTSGARVTSAKLTHEGATEFCKVLGQISSVDPAAQPIRFEVNLPTTWNQKAVHYGGGSFDGWLAATNGLKRTPVSIASQPTPLERGYATFGGDSGHHKHYLLLPDVLNVVNASFARNQEERRNFAQDGLKKTHDAAIAIMEKRYGTAPRRTFFLAAPQVAARHTLSCSAGPMITTAYSAPTQDGIRPNSICNSSASPKRCTARADFCRRARPN